MLADCSGQGKCGISLGLLLFTGTNFSGFLNSGFSGY